MLNGQFADPKLVERFVKAFQKRLAELQKADAANDDSVKRLGEQERRVKNLYEGLAKMGWSEGLAGQIRAEEEKLSTLKSKAAERSRTRPTTVPHPKVVEGYIRNVLTVIGGDPVRGREVLARHVQPFVLTPSDDGGYRINGAFDLATAIRAEEPDADGRVSDNGSRRDRD